MTFSIVARCERTGQIGAAAVTAMQAVGKLACHGKADIGAVASQATLNPYLAFGVLRQMEQGMRAREALDHVLAQDPEPQLRQVGVVDNLGRTAAWSGDNIPKWFGHKHGRGFCTQGNRLAGERVLDEVVRSMRETEHLDLAERLMRAIEAGVAAGGDTKGERSANILVFSSEEYPLCDIRIDDHDDLMAELRRLFTLFQDELLPKVMQLPKRADMRRPV